MSEMHLDLTDLLDQDISSFEYFQSLSGKQRKRLMDMDIRSFGLNFEVNAVIYSERTVHRLERAFENDMTQCTHVTRKVYDERGLMIKAKEQFSRLLSPLL